MSYTIEDFQRQYAKDHFAKLTPEEQREALEALPPERQQELLRALPPEQRLAGCRRSNASPGCRRSNASRACPPSKSGAIWSS